MADAAPETFGFQTEAKQLLKLMIHSLYSNREIFLRELISNASDAIDKLRFQAIGSPELLADDSDFHIDVTFDAGAGTLTLSDNGIGMTRQEVIDHLGTIAKSGTAEFISRLTGDQKKDTALIGQFGVGFYSAFIVADEVEVVTRAAGQADAVRWRSTGEDQFSVEAAERAGRGTDVILHLKADAKDFADGYRLRSIVRRYSDHIAVPVRMLEEKYGDDDKDKTPEFEVVNQAKALWTRSRSDVTDDEYREFYKHVSHDFEEPLGWSHNRVEGKLEYTSLLYLPKRAPFDLWNREAPRGLKLYVQRVFIMDEAEQFLPLYLRFVKGVVDSNDLPLNVSREILQQDERVTTIKNALTKRVLTMLGTMAEKEPEKYQEFWDEFGEVLKEGAGEDFANRETLAGLLRFASTRGEGEKKSVGLDAYLERRVEGQDKIYYVVAESYQHAANSPHLEVLKEQGIEVLLMHDRIDEWLMSSLTEYKDVKFQDAMRADLDLPGEKKEKEEDNAETAALSERIAKVLGEQVEEVRVSHRLSRSPACLVLGQFAMGAQMRRIFAATGQAMPESKPIFEYNPTHPLIQRLDREADEDRFRDLTLVLFDQAGLAEGEVPADAAGYVHRLNGLLLDLLSGE
ncbi:MAG: molecular chaperone HtpG [Pseudomonadales bacterium]|nr:molecular chaperone HtpG [Pseudomonadales bacterium]MCP5183953.1 molecular chaperone HtpG [Pseudomonadales bacterium]